MNKKVFMGIFLILILIANISLASYSTVTMEVVEEPVCTIEIGENSKFEKQLVEKNLNNKEVTLELKVTNGESTLQPNGELVLVIDNSDSMKNEVSRSAIRRDLVYKASETLLNKALENNNDLKVSIVSFSSNSDVSQEATLADATLVSPLSSDLTSLTNALSNIEANGPRTDLDAGLTLGMEQFTEDATNKYMIVVTDGVPNLALDYDNVYYSDDVINKTNAKLKSIEANNIKLFTMLTGIDDEDYTPPTTSKNFGQIINEIFGTPDNPTAGTFYYVTDTEVETTITNDIYNSLLPISKSYENITIVDYFPQEIIDNFDFAYVTEANIGNISAEVDKTNNSITWTIPELKSGETATIRYKLKLKENFSQEIVDKILDTNEKVDITYADYNGETQNKISDVTPKLKLSEPPAELPKAGTITLIGFTVLALGLFGYSLVRLTILNKQMK